LKIGGEAMGKASERRKKRRREYLSKLAVTDPNKFSYEWAKRLESWSHEARKRARTLAGNPGHPDRLAFNVLASALRELESLGVPAVSLEKDATIEALMIESTKAVAFTVDPRIYRLSNSVSNEQKMISGTHRPPR
jgi:hypothetical protein